MFKKYSRYCFVYFVAGKSIYKIIKCFYSRFNIKINLLKAKISVFRNNIHSMLIYRVCEKI